MNTEVVECPACATPIEASQQVQGRTVTCPGCRQVCRIPRFVHPTNGDEPAWRRVLSGLGWTAWGGTFLLPAIFLTIPLIIAIAWLDVPAPLDAEDVPTEGMLPYAILAGLFGVGLLALVAVLVGCFRCLAAPLASRARGWLALSLASLCWFVCCWSAAFALALVMSVILVLEMNPADELGELMLTFGVQGFLLLPLVVWGHGVFLGRIATYVGDDQAASRANAYLWTLFALTPLAALGLGLFLLLFGDEGRAVATASAAALLFILLFVGWWVALVQRVRDGIRKATSC